MKRLLLIYLKTLAKALLAFAALFGGCLFILGEKNRAPYDWELPALQAQADAQRAANKANAEFQTLIADVYHVEQSRFLQPDLLWVTLPPGTPDIQSTCQAIANVWAHRSGLAYVRVESWHGNTRLGQATVYNQQFVTP